MKTSRVKRRKGKHDKSVKHNKKQFKGAGRTNEQQEEQTEEPVLTLADITLNEPEQKNIDNFGKILGFLKKLNKTNDIVKQRLYSNVILSILNDEEFDLSILNEADQAHVLFEIMKTYDDDIINAYVNIQNPYITEKNIMYIIRKIHPFDENDIFSIDVFLNTIDKMKEKKENFPNIKNFLEGKLNIVDTFTSEDTYKIIELIKEYISLKNRGGYGNKLKAIHYKNTIDYILENKQLDLSKINQQDDKYTLLLYVIESKNDKILDAYLKLRNTGLTDEMIEKVKQSLRLEHIDYYNKFIYEIKPKLENKLMKIKAHEEPIMQAEFLTAWKPSGQPLPKELQFNTLSYLQPKAKPTPSGITHDDFMGNAIQYAIDNPKIQTDNSSSNALGGRSLRRKSSRRRRKLRKTMKRK